MIVNDWQKIAAEKPPEWMGDLKDDCTALWAGLTLRAEWMQGQNWWWSVYDDSTKDQIASSDGLRERFLSGYSARKAAEQAARSWLGVE